jgi:hypothetical protein
MGAARLSAALAVLVLAIGVAFAQQGPRRGSPEEARQLLAVVAPAGPFRLRESPDDLYTLALVDDAGRVVGTVGLARDGAVGGESPRLRSRRFAITIGSVTTDPSVTRRLVRAANAVAAWDGGALPEAAVRMRSAPTDGFVAPALLLVLAALAAGAWRRGNITRDLRGLHVVQFVTQGSIFVYWSLYWPGVRGQVPLLGLMLVMGFAADALFSFARYGSWRAGLSVVPVVFSINLFEWFDARGAVIAIVAAFACKHLVHRGGRHIFNPSVAGLTVTGLVTVLAPGYVHFGGLFHTLNVPPNMAEWILLVTLVPQLRFRIMPVSIGTLLALYLWGIPGVLRPTILIAMTLLATDPATSPRTDLGKLLFGLTFGGLLPAWSLVLRGLGQPDDFAKILAIPAANLLVPQLDAVAIFLVARAAATRDRLLASAGPRAGLAPATVAWLGEKIRRPIPNAAFVGCWLLLIVPRLMEEKPRYFEPEIHWNYATPLVVRDADDVPRCARNPVFCEVFSMPREAALWVGRGRGDLTRAAAPPSP